MQLKVARNTVATGWYRVVGYFLKMYTVQYINSNYERASVRFIA